MKAEQPGSRAEARAELMRDRPANRYPGVDALRGCAALAVLVFHTSQACDLTFSYGVLASALAVLKQGVTVFFVISGFVLYLPWARAIRDRRPLPDWRRYARRRAVRILPAYWVALVICTAAGVGASTRLSDWWRYVSLTETYKASTLGGGLGVAWSLCVELAFYILLPFLACALSGFISRQRRLCAPSVQLACLGALSGGSLLLRYGLTGSVALPVAATHIVAASSLPYLFDWFATGMTLAVVAAEWESGSSRFSALRELVIRPWLCWAIAGGFIALVVSEHTGDIFLPQSDLFTHVVLGAAAAFLVLPGLSSHVARRREGLPGRLGRRALAFAGTVSYGVYLWHKPILAIIGGEPHAQPTSALKYATLVLAVTAGSLAVGAASWYRLERPLQRSLARGAPKAHRIHAADLAAAS